MIPAKNYPLNCGNVNSNFVINGSKRILRDRRANIVVEKIDRNISSSATTLTEVGDRIVNRSTTGTSVSDFKLSHINSSPDKIDNSQIFFSSSNPSVLSIQDDIATFQSVGTAVLQSQTYDGEISSLNVQTSSGIAVNSDEFVSWKSGSLARTIYDDTTAMISGINNQTQAVTVIDCSMIGCYPLEVKVGSPMRYWNQWAGNRHLTETGGVSGHTNPDGPWVRDTSFWLYDIDFTCISQWTSGNNSFLVRGTLITPEHCISCAHGHEPNIGDTLFFVSNDAGSGNQETVFKRTIISKQRVVKSGINNIDLTITRLSSPLPDKIKPAKVLPKTWFNKMVGFGNDADIPIVKWNQDHHGLIAYEWYPLAKYFIGSSYIEPPRLAFGTALKDYLNYTSKIRFLDSGNPNFLIINGEAILVGVHTTPDTGPMIAAFYDEINSILQSLGGSTTSLTSVDLSSFPTFTNPYL